MMLTQPNCVYMETQRAAGLRGEFHRARRKRANARPYKAHGKTSPQPVTTRPKMPG